MKSKPLHSLEMRPTKGQYTGIPIDDEKHLESNRTTTEGAASVGDTSNTIPNGTGSYNKSDSSAYTCYLVIAVAFIAMLLTIDLVLGLKLYSVTLSPCIESSSKQNGDFPEFTFASKNSLNPLSIVKYKNNITLLRIPQAVVHDQREYLFVQQITTGIGIKELFFDAGSVLSQILIRFRHSRQNKLDVIAFNTAYRDSLNQFNPYLDRSFTPTILYSFDIMNVSSPGDQNNFYYVEINHFLLEGTGKLNGNDFAAQFSLSFGSTLKYQLDYQKSYIKESGSKVTAKGTFFETVVTYSLENASAAPLPSQLCPAQTIETLITYSVRHSLISVPSLQHDQFQLRLYHPKSGLNSIKIYEEYVDAFSPRDRHYVVRHFLQSAKEFNTRNSNDNSTQSTTKLIYRIDPHTPLEYHQCFKEGIAWWDEAFQYAGYPKGTITAVLASEEDDLFDISDPSLHSIHWVNRDRRSYSVGARVIDPRTGRIVHGAVRIEALRFRQLALIVQAVLGPSISSNTSASKSSLTDNPPPSHKRHDIILSRCKQLIAHEVGHTLGLSHNFAGSTSPEGSVMDYPTPLVTIDSAGSIIFNNLSYFGGIGFYDKVSIDYAYRQLNATLSQIQQFVLLSNRINQAEMEGYKVVTDEDSAPELGDWRGTKWDSGADPIISLNISLQVRAAALSKFNQSTVPYGYPLSVLREVFPILFLWHRYEVEAVGKLLGGHYFEYAVRGDQHDSHVDQRTKDVDSDTQFKALIELLRALDPTTIAIPLELQKLLLTNPKGYDDGVLGGPGDILFSRNGIYFDPIAAYEVAAELVFLMLFAKQRMERLVVQSQSSISLHDMLNRIIQTVMVDWPVLCGLCNAPFDPNPPFQNLFRDADHSQSSLALLTIQSVLVNDLLKAMHEPHSARVYAVLSAQITIITSTLHSRECSEQMIDHFIYLQNCIAMKKPFLDDIIVPAGPPI